MPTSQLPAELSLRQFVARGARPFPSHPQVDRYFPAAAIEDARRRLTRAIDRGDGPGLVIGAAGMGKSLLLQVLAAHYRQRLDVVLLACARLCSRRALLQAILFELGLPYRLRDEGQLRLSLLDHLLSAKPSPTELLLLVDEAQTLPVALLDELRVMTNLIHGGVPRVRLVLAGAPALEESFAGPDMESFSQRLAARCYLTPLKRDETAQFVRAQLAASGAAADEVTCPEAMEAVFEATDGVPRLVNQLCDRAITVAEGENCTRIDRRVIQAAWSDLQQLPMPWETPTAVAAAPSPTGTIEFGSLDENKPIEQTPAPASQDVLTPDRSEVRDAEPVAARCESPSTVERDSADPFDEPFVEEEVLLDNFAAWSAVLDMGTPRVDNRRDREFASLVQAALDAADAENGPISDRHGRSSTSGLAPRTNVNIDGWQVTELDAHDENHSLNESDADWPPIRLAVVDEAAPPPATGDRPTGNSAELPAATHDDAIDGDPPADEAPILMVEDEAADEPHSKTPAPAYAQVRRHDYRNLFSRLRSG